MYKPVCNLEGQVSWGFLIFWGILPFLGGVVLLLQRRVGVLGARLCSHVLQGCGQVILLLLGMSTRMGMKSLLG